MIVTTPLSIAPFKDADVIADWNSAFQMLEAGELESYSGQFVAILNGEVVGSGAHPTKLYEEVSHTRGVAQERLVVMFVEAF